MEGGGFSLAKVGDDEPIPVNPPQFWGDYSLLLPDTTYPPAGIPICTSLRDMCLYSWVSAMKYRDFTTYFRYFS